VTTELSLFDFLIDDCATQSALDHELLVDPDESALESYDLANVEVRRSKRRKKTSEAYRQNGKIVVVVPWRLNQQEISLTVADLIEKLRIHEQRHLTAESLQNRARFLVDTYFDRDVLGEHHVPVVIRWVTNQNSRWGSCTPATGSIRLSHRLQKMPQYVQDAVLFHELIHLIVLNHSKEFHALMNRYPDLAQAQAFLDGYALATYQK